MEDDTVLVIDFGSRQVRILTPFAELTRLCYRRQGTAAPHSHAAFRAFGEAHRAGGGLAGMAGCGSQAAGGVQQGAGEPAQRQAGQLSRGEPGELAELAVTRCRGTADDPGFIDPGDIGGAVAVRVADLVVRAAEHVGQAHQLDEADVLCPVTEKPHGRRIPRKPK